MAGNFQGATAWVLISLLLVIAAFDFYAALYMPQGATVSAYIHALSVKHPVVPFFVGLVIGHLLWPPAVGIKV